LGDSTCRIAVGQGSGETDNVLEVQDSSFNQENNNFSPEKTVSEDVYEEEELLQNPDEEIPG